jgi:hypothetical protein
MPAFPTLFLGLNPKISRCATQPAGRSVLKVRQRLATDIPT